MELVITSILSLSQISSTMSGFVYTVAVWCYGCGVALFLLIEVIHLHIHNYTYALYCLIHDVPRVHFITVEDLVT